MLDTNLGDWNLYLSVANVPVVAVNANSPYKTMPELLDAMKAKPGEITVATAGVTSGGHNAMEAISRATGVKYRHVTYDGGNPAVVATVAGETAGDDAARGRAGRHDPRQAHPAARRGERQAARVIEGYGTIEPITKWVAGLPGARPTTSASSSRRACRRRSWRRSTSLGGPRSRRTRRCASTRASRGAVFAPVAGDAAQKAAFPAVQANAWLMHDSGKSKVSPDTVGIPRP